MSKFTDMMHPYAQRASSATGIAVEVILGQWVHETADGTSNVFKNANNAAGIKKVENSIASGNYGAYAKYSSLDQFTSDYIRVMKLSYYDKVRQASGIEAQAQALGMSPYAESHYSEIDYDKDGKNEAGESILYRIKQQGLASVSGTVNGTEFKVPMPNVESMSQSQLKQYAIIGAIVLGVVAAMK
jgi:hypothetical protein